MSDVKCPICESELVTVCEQDGIIPNPNKGKVYCISCDKCNIYGSPKLWQALDIAVDKLRGIKTYYDDNYNDPHTFVNWHTVAQRLANDADDAIKQITEIKDE